MNDPRLDYKNEFPVELVNPDISPYKKTNTGVDYVITLDSGLSGPHVFISSIVQALTVACVPTGMNAGVCIFPRWVSIKPHLANLSFFNTLKANFFNAIKKIIEI